MKQGHGIGKDTFGISIRYSNNPSEIDKIALKTRNDLPNTNENTMRSN